MESPLCLHLAPPGENSTLLWLQYKTEWLWRHEEVLTSYRNGWMIRATIRHWDKLLRQSAFYLNISLGLKNESVMTCVSPIRKYIFHWHQRHVACEFNSCLNLFIVLPTGNFKGLRVYDAHNLYLICTCSHVKHFHSTVETNIFYISSV